MNEHQRTSKLEALGLGDTIPRCLLKTFPNAAGKTYTSENIYRNLPGEEYACVGRSGSIILLKDLADIKIACEFDGYTITFRWRDGPYSTWMTKEEKYLEIDLPRTEGSSICEIQEARGMWLADKASDLVMPTLRSKWCVYEHALLDFNRVADKAIPYADFFGHYVKFGLLYDAGSIHRFFITNGGSNTSRTWLGEGVPRNNQKCWLVSRKFLSAVKLVEMFEGGARRFKVFLEDTPLSESVECLSEGGVLIPRGPSIDPMAKLALSLMQQLDSAKDKQKVTEEVFATLMKQVVGEAPKLDAEEASRLVRSPAPQP